jgi:DNA anti-recombination protein RmuC
MDHNMALFLATVEVGAVLLILLLLLRTAAQIDKSKASDQESGAATISASSSDKFEQVEKSDIAKLGEDLARLEQHLKPILDLTIKHERRLSGIRRKGILGEQLVGETLTDLPHDWYDIDVPFSNGARVEFAIRTPDRRWIPIDSQWTATELLDQLEQATDQSERESFRAKIHEEVRNYATSAERFLDPATTLGFCIVAVPNSVFELCIDIQAELVGRGVVLIGHSLLVPYILLLFNLYLKDTKSTEALEISHILSRSASQIELIKKYINSKVRPSIESAKLQQNQYGEHSLKLHDIYSRLNQIQSDLDGVRNMVNPTLHKDISSIPNILHSSLTKVREDLLEGVERLNDHKPHIENK